MKIDKKLIIGAIAAGLTATVAFIGTAMNLPATVIAPIIGAIAWLAAWLNARNNTV